MTYLSAARLYPIVSCEEKEVSERVGERGELDEPFDERGQNGGAVGGRPW